MSALGLRLAAWQARGDGAGIRDYVQDGLALHYDGRQPTRDGSAHVGTWEDWSPHRHDTIGHVTARPAPAPQDCAWHFSYGGFLLPLEIMDLLASGVYTLEFVCAPQPNGNLTMVAAGVLDALECILFLYADPFRMRFMLASAAYASAQFGQYGRRYSLCMAGDKSSLSYFADGVKKSQQSAVLPPLSRAAEGEYVSIGRVPHKVGSAANQMLGNVHAVRMYDRVLTDAEIASNAAIDALRFGAGA